MPLTIGQRLKQAREYRLLTIEKASDATRIRINYLKSLEADDYSVMPSAAQARGFLHNYAEFLDIDLDAVLAELQQNAPKEADVSGPLPSLEMTPEQPADEPSSPRFWTRWLVRKPKAESAPELEFPEPEPEQIQAAPVEVIPNRKGNRSNRAAKEEVRDVRRTTTQAREEKIG